MSVPRNFHPDKIAISTDSVVSIFHIKLPEHETDIKIVCIRDRLTLQLGVCEACGSIAVMGIIDEGRNGDRELSLEGRL